jgi:hypothetical protein
MADVQQHEPARRSLIEDWVDFVKGPAGIAAGVMALLALVGTAVTLANAGRGPIGWFWCRSTARCACS